MSDLERSLIREGPAGTATYSAMLYSAQTTKARSAARRVKVGRLEPGDIWGMQHARGAKEAGFEIVAVEECEVKR